MRQQLDLATLCLPTNLSWFKDALDELRCALDKIKLHDERWLTHLEHDVLPDPDLGSSDYPPSVLAQSMLVLRRYDALILPVSLQTLGWTRQCLASIPRGPALPILGVLKELRCGAMMDLVELGMTDFVRLPVCPQEFRARLLGAVCRAPRQLPLRDAASSGQVLGYDPRRPGHPRPMHVAEPKPVSFVRFDGGFAQAKHKVTQLFEREYLQTAMQRAGGRITQAARNSKKDRRAFWELLRKHDMLKDWPAQRRGSQKSGRDS